MNFVFHLQNFEAPGDEVWRQLIGMAMGASSAPRWANFILRWFELSAPRLPAGAYSLVWKFIDNALMVLSSDFECHLTEHLSKTYHGH